MEQVKDTCTKTDFLKTVFSQNRFIGYWYGNKWMIMRMQLIVLTYRDKEFSYLQAKVICNETRANQFFQGKLTCTLHGKSSFYPEPSVNIAR